MSVIVILTALEVERAAVVTNLKSTSIITIPEVGTDFVKGKFDLSNGNHVNVVVGRTDQTNVNAGIETERAITHFKPSHIFFVGVAGGLKDVSVGDVVIGRDVIGYERGKAEDANFKPRAQFGASSYDMERSALAYASSEAWKTRAASLTDVKFAPKILVFSGTIASGEKVDASTKSELHKHIKQNASHALAVEMEGLGFLEVCRMHPLTKSLLLRGISDLVEDKSGMDSLGSQPYASQNVSAFLFGLISQFDFDQATESTLKSDLINIMCMLYPGGLRDNGIWSTAGGDLSLINVNQSGKGQWVEAVTKLTQGGGGGSITPKSLITAVFEENRYNPDVKKIYDSLI